MTDSERAGAILDEICGRLRSLAENRPFSFVDTSRRNAQKYLDRQVHFEGYSEEEIAATERRLNVVFPTVFRTYLNRLGKAQGELFVGSDVAGLQDFGRLKTYARTLLRESEVADELPHHAVVFLLHQGYTFCFFLATNDFDCPIMNYAEDEPEPTQSCSSFAELLRLEVQLMEEVNQQTIEQGGFFLSVGDDGSVGRRYPSLSNGIRPVDMDDAFTD